MFYVISTLGIIVGLGFVFFSITDYRGTMTRLFATKKKTSLGFKAISVNARQMRVWYLILGLLLCIIGTLGLIA
jgi:hypothetical protein